MVFVTHSMESVRNLVIEQYGFIMEKLEWMEIQMKL